MPDNSTLAGPDGTQASFTIDTGDTAWVMICACLVFLMVHFKPFFFFLQIFLYTTYYNSSFISLNIDPLISIVTSSWIFLCWSCSC
jgi:ammonia channel protein AmtB